MADHDSLVQHFSAVSGVDADRAKFYLEAAAWDLPTALSSFFEESGEEPRAAARVSSVEAVDPAQEESVPTAGSAGDESQTSRTLPTEMRSAWVAAMTENDSDSEEEGQAFYAGGSQHSGQQVLGPKKKKDMVAKLFKAAKQQGAEVMTEGGEGSGQKTLKATFKGTSYRLGETPTDTQVIPDAASSSERSPQPVELRLYRTGFTVDDGPLRGYLDEENVRFLSDIKQGRIPMELIRASGGREVAINMSDMRHEKYEPPKKSMKAFTGSGQTLGSPAPSVVGQVTNVPGPGGSANRAPADPNVAEQTAKEQLNVDAAQPTTNVQIRLTDGSRLVVRANQSHTVADLRRYLDTARPEYSTQSIALMTTFPHAELAQPELTLASANLLNAAIVVKPK